MDPEHLHFHFRHCWTYWAILGTTQSRRKDSEKYVGGRAGFVCIQLSPFSPRASEGGSAHFPGTPTLLPVLHALSLSAPAQTMGDSSIVPARSSSSPTFLLEKGQYNLTKFISALPPIPFSQNAALHLTFLKSWDYGQELKVSLSSFF